jgi:hypothetical protein
MIFRKHLPAEIISCSFCVYSKGKWRSLLHLYRAKVVSMALGQSVEGRPALVEALGQVVGCWVVLSDGDAGDP